ncbi:hypothetical protein ACIA8F_26095 [Streptomyces sp. NPDC051563]|uniref:hypothetical protein n=1 Tax=Streptomyces sp. NPDC051563 TaxID=3365659 RepID=UPI00378AA7D0
MRTGRMSEEGGAVGSPCPSGSDVWVSRAGGMLSSTIIGRSGPVEVSVPHSNPPPGWRRRDSRPPAGPLAPRTAPKRPRTALIVVLGVLAALIALGLTGLLITVVDPGGDRTKGRDGESSRSETPATVAPPAPNSPAPDSPAPSSRPTGQPAEPDRGPTGDVKIDSCGVDPTTRWPSAGLTITNSGKRTSTYLVSIEFLGPTGTRLAEGAGISNGLAPGQRAEVKAAALARLTENAITCKVLKVDRIAP